jgi:hypothetical protein
VPSTNKVAQSYASFGYRRLKSWVSLEHAFLWEFIGGINGTNVAMVLLYTCFLDSNSACVDSYYYRGAWFERPRSFRPLKTIVTTPH